LEVLWQQSFISNKIISLIYKDFLNKKIPETEMNAGLLSNIGIIFMIHCFKDKYIGMIDKIKSQHINIIELENEIFGTNHQEVGGYLLRWWDIPLPIVEVALYHHNPFNENIINQQIVHVSHIAEKYSWDMLGEGYFIDFDEKVFKTLEIDRGDFEQKLKESLEFGN